MAALALAVSAIVGAPVVRDEWLSARLEAAAARDLGGPPPLPWEEGGSPALCDHTCPPRALAASGVLLAVQSARDFDPDRRRGLLAEAKRRLSRALAIRPSSGGWWTWLAYAQALDGSDVQDVLRSVSRSYAAAGFLADEGPWRTLYCAANWSLAPPSLRAHVVDEVVWMTKIDPANATMAAAAFVDPDAAAALKAGLARATSTLAPHRRSGGPGGVGATR